MYSAARCGTALAIIVEQKQIIRPRSSVGLKDAEIYLSRGLARFNQWDYLGAEQDFSEAIRLGQQDAPVYQFRFQSYLRLGRDEEALQDLQKAQALAPEEAYTHFCMGEYFLSCREYSQAIQAYRQAQAADGGHGWYFELGLGCLLAGQYDAARQAYQAGLAEDPPGDLGIATRRLDYWTQSQADRLETDEARRTAADIRELLVTRSSRK